MWCSCFISDQLYGEAGMGLEDMTWVGAGRGGKCGIAGDWGDGCNVRAFLHVCVVDDGRHVVSTYKRMHCRVSLIPLFPASQLPSNLRDM